jgi:ketosteroid isomerase-like protein
MKFTHGAAGVAPLASVLRRTLFIGAASAAPTLPAEPCMTDRRADAIRTLLERYVQAWRAGDLRAAAACYHADFTLHYFGANGLSGTHAGKARALAILAEFGRRTQRRLVRVEAILAGPERGALVAREAFRRGDETAECERVSLYATRDELLSECWVYDSDQRLVDAVVGETPLP